MHIAIIGAGLSGLTAANLLKDTVDITLFEKSCNVGGRMATRYADPYSFDYGTQFFTAKTHQFQAFIEPMLRAGIIKIWGARFAEINNKKITYKRQWDQHFPHYVGTPGMSAIAQYLAQGLNIKLRAQVQCIRKQGNQWHLLDNRGQSLGKYNWVVLTIPVRQAVAILGPILSSCQDLVNGEDLANKKMHGCFSLMLGFPTPLALSFDAALVRNEDISWISVNSSKPERGKAFSLLIHSTNAWADQHIDDDKDLVMQYLCEQVSKIVEYDVSAADLKALYAWRFANIKKQYGKTHLIDGKQQLALCGDWFIQGRVEAAFSSGFKMANDLLKIVAT